MTMEMVYATHSFQAVCNEELEFEYGEPIIVLEKDGMYGDGWWQGRNIRGKIGLFPMSYTSHNKPKNPLDNMNFLNNNLSIVTPESSKIDVEDFNEQNSNLSIFENTIEDLQNKLQLMINNNTEGSFNKKTKEYSSGSRLSTSSTSTGSYFSATIDSEINSQRNSQLIDDHMKTLKNSSSLSVNNIIKEHPITWDIQQVCQWLNENGFNSEKIHFIENDVTGDILLELTLDTLKEINITSFGKRVHILNAINTLKEQCSTNDNQETEKAQSLSSNKINDSSQSLPTFDYHFSKAPSGSRRSSYHSNDQKNDSNPTLSVGSEKPKMVKKSSRIFSKFGSFAKSNSAKSNKEEKVKKLDKSQSPSTGGWNFSMNIKELERINQEKERRSQIKSKTSSIYEEAISEPEKSLSLKFIPGRKQKINSLDRKCLVGNQLGLPKELLDNDNSRKRVNSFYSDHNVDYVDADDDALKDIGIPDYEGWLKKQGDKYKTWKNRFCILKGSNLYYLRSDKIMQTSKVKGHINLTGYRVIPDENLCQGKYGFKLVHDTERPHFFVHENLERMKGWMKAIMKATIERDITVPIISSNHVPTVSLSEARKAANQKLPPNILTDIINNSTDILPLTPTFSNLPPRPAPSPPIFEHNHEKASITIPTSSLPKPKAPPTGALPPCPKPSSLNLNSPKIIKSTSSEPLSPSFASRSKYSTSRIPNSPTRIRSESLLKQPKFPSMSISVPNAPGSPSFPPENNKKYNENSMGYYV